MLAQLWENDLFANLANVVAGGLAKLYCARDVARTCVTQVLVMVNGVAQSAFWILI